MTKSTAAEAELLSQEAELIRKAVAGEADAFARLYDAYVDDIYRFIFYRVSDEPTAEDLTSQVFIKAWDNLPRYEVRGSRFGAWLFQIARNNVIDHYRARKPTTPLEPLALSMADPAINVAETVENRLQGEWLRRMLHHLTDDQREVLTLKFINGLGTAEVAKIMKKRQGAIRALQMRALKALGELLGAANGEEEGK